MFIVTFGPLGEGLKGMGGNADQRRARGAVVGRSADIDGRWPPWALDLVDTVIGGVGSRAVVHAADSCCCFLFLSVLEDSGYMSRAAFLMDGMLAQDRAERQGVHSDADGVWLHGAGRHGFAGAGT